MNDSATTRRGAREGGALVWFVLLSMVLHVAGGIGAASLPSIGDERDDEQTDTDDRKMKVTLSQMPEAIPEPRSPKTKTREEQNEKKRAKKKPTDKKRKQDTPDTTAELNRKTVDQSNNEQVPESADYLASEANATEQQTQARKTTTRRQRTSGEQTPSNREKSKAKGGQNPAAMAARSEPQRSRTDNRERSEPPPAPKPSTPERQPQKKPSEESQEPTERRESPVESDEAREDGEIKKSQPSERDDSRRQRAEKREAPPMPTMGDYERLFGGENQDRSRSREKSAEGQGGPGHELFANIDKRQGRVKAALENYLTHIKPGNHTSVNARRSVYASYINRIHRKIHVRWGGGYLPRLERQFGPGHPLSNPDLRTLLEIVVDAESGKVEDVNIVSSSGVTSYDAEAVMIAYGTGPHPNPPEEVISPDGNIYLHWNFWRDQKQCGTFGVTVYKRLEGGGGKQKVPPSGDGG